MLIRGIVAMALLAALAAPVAAQPSPTPTPTPTPKPCAAPDQLLAVNELPKAREKYGEVLAADPTEPCAIDGLRRVVDAYIARAETLLAAGQTEQALPAIIAAYELSPTQAKPLLDRLAPADAIEVAKGLEAHGLRDEARTVLVDALKKTPATTPLPSELGPVVARERPSWWQDKLDRAAAPARMVGEIVIIALLAWVLLQFLHSRARRRLRLGAFTGPAADGKDSTETLASKEFAALVRSRIDAISSAQRGGRVDLASGAGGPVAIPASLVEGVPQARLVTAILELIHHLAPPNERTLTVTLLTESPRGLGVTATLEARTARRRATRTFWTDEMSARARTAAPGTYLPLVVVVAAWALAEFRPRAFPGLGTRDPLSYALFAAGAAEQGRAW